MDPHSWNPDSLALITVVQAGFPLLCPQSPNVLTACHPILSLLVEGAALVHAAQVSIENSARSVNYLNEHLRKNDALCT